MIEALLVPLRLGVSARAFSYRPSARAFSCRIATGFGIISMPHPQRNPDWALAIAIDGSALRRRLSGMPLGVVFRDLDFEGRLVERGCR
ncbi:hypothetical protein [Thiohalocapsa sp. ML1]|jgi:hypothetical protein|uniref:hypothetical protein n=1 Tax=Thiohalocapsa sp. ML1 TaxID=1431688 RepID=UPI0012E3A5C0|nr:hypothetical protein [Thiohalocapsa sp. ML1]